MTDIVPIRRALISVFDKTGLPKLAQALASRGVEIISTGSSAAALRAKGIAVTEVSDHTGLPESLAKQFEMLLPSIQGGVLGPRDCPEDLAQMAASGIAPIDLVVVNLCPFEAAVAAGGDPDACVAAIAVDGPALIRAAAKNHAHVAVLTEPAQYFALQEQVETIGGTTLALRKRLAATAYAFTAAYDTDISRWLAQAQGVTFPHRLNVSGVMRQTLRYGENPHQQAALYVSGDRPGVATATRIQGKELSYNNVADADAALECVAEFDSPTIVIVKHANPRGVATAATLAQAWDAALAGDPASTIEGIVAANRTLDATVAERIVATSTEVIIAPDAYDAARAILAGKKDCRLLLTGRLPDPSAPGLLIRSVAGGFLAQTRDAGQVQAADLRVVTKRSPTAAELNDLLFAFRVCKHVRSNAIVYARAGATVSIGAGQMSRIDSARVATWKGEAAGRALRGSVAASDAFFPLPTGWTLSSPRARPPSSSLAAPTETPRSLPPPTPPGSPWCLPVCANSVIEEPPRNPYPRYDARHDWRSDPSRHTQRRSTARQSTGVASTLKWPSPHSLPKRFGIGCRPDCYQTHMENLSGERAY